MKKLLLLIVWVFTVNFCYCQMAVTDVGATTQVAAGNAKSEIFFGKSISQAIAQVEQLTSLKDKYIEQMNLVKEVNSYLSNGKQMLRIKSSVRDITKEYSEALTYIKDEPIIDYQSKGKLIKGYSVKLDESLGVFEDAVMALSSNLNMNDAERLSILNNADEKLKNQKSFLVYLRAKISYNVQKQKETQSNASFIKNEVQSINKIRQ
jgi:hypothetical protein